MVLDKECVRHDHLHTNKPTREPIACTLAPPTSTKRSGCWPRAGRASWPARPTSPAVGERPLQGSYVDVSNIRHCAACALMKSASASARRRPGARSPARTCRGFDALKAAAREIGAVQIQNRGTIAGNLCNASPAADGAPPLLALDAEVELVIMRGVAATAARRASSRAPGALCWRPDEILDRDRHAPTARGRCASAFLKLGARRYLVISIVMVAVAARHRRRAGARGARRRRRLFGGRAAACRRRAPPDRRAARRRPRATRSRPKISRRSRRSTMSALGGLSPRSGADADASRGRVLLARRKPEARSDARSRARRRRHAQRRSRRG